MYTRIYRATTKKSIQEDIVKNERNKWKLNTKKYPNHSKEEKKGETEEIKNRGKKQKANNTMVDLTPDIKTYIMCKWFKWANVRNRDC